MEFTGEGRACIPVGLIKINWTMCVCKIEEKIYDYQVASDLQQSDLAMLERLLESATGGHVISSFYFHIFVPIGP